MRDGPIRRMLKAGARMLVLGDLAFKRRWARARGRHRWLLAGECGGCAKCCEAPTIAVPRTLATWWTLRTAFLWWQRAVNGFELVATERRPNAFVFRCTHFDTVTRRCDSYESRPAMCRDYPRLLLDRPWPLLFNECGYRAKPTGTPDLIAALRAAEGLGDERRQALEKKLGLRD